MKIENIKPQDIEKKSFEIITEILGDRVLDEENADVIKRAIHTSADFDYADNLYFSEGITKKLVEAIKNGADIVTDTQMAKSGINKTLLAKHGGEVHCFMSDEDVAKEAKERGVTRAIVSMEKAARLNKPVIFAIGNAPTALIKVDELIKEGKVSPVGVIGVPVGFVNVIESKERIINSGVPCIVARGRKGGSNIAAAIVNALIYKLGRN
ncbi:MAG: precorrin-8X methylmutase [Clostridium sp.]|uniref:precorrin-8X methylmutase n=1 Tax=Clostridium sp. DSM 8431 TaxID=1761781 RepID=UPI0008E61FF4|nr:precorrin-8X methylmutase [Clostridium sp. DSM 8431]MCR4943707.1 precorrin-8X methylmutase [Clostridium sp.]SFU42344.1 precorrin-8X methylmutase [Clostridium sp. DSM 8431]